MELSESIENINFIHDKSGLNLYYNYYKYKILVRLERICMVRYIQDLVHFEKRLEQTYNYGNWSINDRGATPKITIRDTIIVDGGNIDELKNFILWRSVNSKECKIIVNQNFVHIYFNDTKLLNNFLYNFPDKKTKIKGLYRVKLKNYNPEVIYQVNPKHKFRMYLTAKNLTFNEVKDFNVTCLENNIKPCPSLSSQIERYFMDQKYRNYYRKFFVYYNSFVDFDEEYLFTLMSLKFPELIKKFYHIERR